ncbi:MAG TPA: polysaccharide deacetylase family protein [Microbacterium sp.]|uniref:polysaccharide deacetylase family protein n=1 Tax=Microbacterium sp. TaxID=51671 RepID=UPI002CF206E3|nr:polysaccharide deacetylase family protein [Microbacterium sp.]HWI32154.1 polysaccharide deacetylase family protein [Microbacterium sp.]
MVCTAAIVGAIASTIAVIAVLQRSAGTNSPTASMSPAPTRDTTPTPTPTPLTPAERLLADSGDANACVVSFAGEAILDAPVLEQRGLLYAHLPIPMREGAVFAGWYPSPQDAAAFAQASRINGADAVVCTDRQITLYGAWKSPQGVAAADVGVPILMYHQFTTRPEGESGWLRGNYAYIGDFDAHMAYLAQQQFYLPTWDELSAFIDGRLFLPARSAIVTDDDADQTWFDLAVPVIDAHKVLATSFMITAYRQDPAPSPYVLRRSHTHDMHQGGDNGDGRMVNWTADEIAADLVASAGVLGVKEVMAYPFGDYSDTAKQGVAQAGFTMARTIEPGYVRIGTDKLALPTIRIDYGMGLDAFIGLVGR